MADETTPGSDDAAPEEAAAGAASPGSPPDGAAAPSGAAWAITTRLNRFTRKFLGPAQVGDRAPDTRVPDSLPSTPCSVCGRPLTEHELVRTTDAKMRLYCPDAAR